MFFFLLPPFFFRFTISLSFHCHSCPLFPVILWFPFCFLLPLFGLFPSLWISHGMSFHFLLPFFHVLTIYQPVIFIAYSVHVAHWIYLHFHDISLPPLISTTHPFPSFLPSSFLPPLPSFPSLPSFLPSFLLPSSPSFLPSFLLPGSSFFLCSFLPGPSFLPGIPGPSFLPSLPSFFHILFTSFISPCLFSSHTFSAVLCVVSSHGLMRVSCSAHRLSAVQQRRRHRPRGSNLSVCNRPLAFCLFFMLSPRSLSYFVCF